MSDRRLTFRIESGYGQTIEIYQVGISGLFVMRTTQEHWDDDGETLTRVDEIECVLEPPIAHRIAVALYHGVADAGERGSR